MSSSDLATAKILQPENYHGDFQLAFRLLSSDTAILDAAQFSAQSDIANNSIKVVPDVEQAADQAELKLILGGTTSDFADAIIPVVAVSRAVAQTAAFKLIGGDPAGVTLFSLTVYQMVYRYLLMGSIAQVISILAR